MKSKVKVVCHLHDSGGPFAFGFRDKMRDIIAESTDFVSKKWGHDEGNGMSHNL